MKDTLLTLLDAFSENLTKYQYDQYIPKLRDYFIPYLLINKGHISDIKRLLCNEITLSDISNSTIFYITSNENIESLSAINDYLIALNKFFDDVIYPTYPNPTLAIHKNFNSLYDEINATLISMGIHLRNPEVNPPLTEEDLPFILLHLNFLPSDSLKRQQVKCITKLMLLYGFSTDKIATFKLTDFNRERNTLKVSCDNTEVYLELPFTLAQQIHYYTQSRVISSHLLFLKQTGKPISNDFTTEFFEEIKKDVPISLHHSTTSKNRFTNTGFQKYALIQMILKGINIGILEGFTGQGSNIIEDCQSHVNNIQKLKRNRYINHMIRGLEIYDLL